MEARRTHQDRVGARNRLTRRVALRQLGGGGIAAAGAAMLNSPAHEVSARQESETSRADFLAIGQGVVDALNGDVPSAFDAWVAEDVTGHVPLFESPAKQNRAWLAEKWELSRKAFPNREITLDGVVVEGDLIAAHGTARGTHDGAIGLLPPTGNKLSVGYVIVARVADGKVVEYWYQLDTLLALKQLGLFSLEDGATCAEDY